MKRECTRGQLSWPLIMFATKLPENYTKYIEGYVVVGASVGVSVGAAVDGVSVGAIVGDPSSLEGAVVGPSVGAFVLNPPVA